MKKYWNAGVNLFRSRQDDSFLRRVIQHMQDNNGIQKGIRTILRERELRHDGSKLDC